MKKKIDFKFECDVECVIKKVVFTDLKIKSMNDFIFTVSSVKRSTKKNRGFTCNFAYMKYKKGWFDAITSGFGQNTLYDPKEKDICIDVCYYKHGKLYDDENFRGGTKPIPDALRSLGWIFDDNTKRIGTFLHQKRAKKNEIERVEVSIIEKKLDLEVVFLDSSSNELGKVEIENNNMTELVKIILFSKKIHKDGNKIYVSG